MKWPIFFLFIFLMSAGIITNAQAHTEINIEDYVVDIGWGDEPPVVGLKNFIIITINQELEGKLTGVTNAFENIQVFARSGGVSKELDIIEDSEPGVYHANIIPTQVGTIAIK